MQRLNKMQRPNKRNKFSASCLWLKENDAISEEDLQEIYNIREHRNKIAHELINFLTDADSEIDMEKFTHTRYLLAKIDRWWIMEVHIPTSSDYDGQDIQESDVKSGRMVIIDAISEIMFDNTDEEKVS